MKIILRLLIGLSFFVAGVCKTSAQLPDSLDVGSNFPPATRMTVDMYILDVQWHPTNLLDLSTGQWYTNVNAPAGADLQAVAQKAWEGLVSRFVPKAGTEGWDYQGRVEVDTFLGETDAHSGYQTVGCIGIPNNSVVATFKLAEIDGRWTIPENLRTLNPIATGYPSYIPCYVGGLKSAAISVTNVWGGADMRGIWETGTNVMRYLSPNGVEDPDCTLYPLGSAYYGPDILQLETRIVVPEIRAWSGWYWLPGSSATATLTLTNNESATYDLLTGKKVAGTQPLTLSIRPAASVTPNASPGKALSTGSVPISLSVSGPPGVISIECAASPAGPWVQLLNVTSFGTAPVGATDSGAPPGGRFYRARLN